MENKIENKITKHKSKKNRETKLILSFDETRRRDYLTGFRRRKKERQTHYKEKLENKIRNEKKEFRKEAKELMSKAHLEPDMLPDVEDLVKPTVVDLPEHTVIITDITEVDFSGGCGLRLGKNLVNETREDYTSEYKQNKDVKELTKQKSAMKKRMEHISTLEVKHKMITDKLECKAKNKHKKRRRGNKSKMKKGNKKGGRKK
ncbi:hypothetical protein SNE40_019343 [Patella caerulea]|uniref:Nucleolar protein 12 n=1 Tax=Patella caerulea TaxID=87958 RepID=A0AAN8J9B5_PATCE